MFFLAGLDRTAGLRMFARMAVTALQGLSMCAHQWKELEIGCPLGVCWPDAANLHQRLPDASWDWEQSVVRRRLHRQAGSHTRSPGDGIATMALMICQPLVGL